jgi:hypothetical protein
MAEVVDNDYSRNLLRYDITGRSGEQATHDTMVQSTGKGLKRPPEPAKQRDVMAVLADTASHRLLEIAHSQGGSFTKMTLADAREIADLVIRAGIIGLTPGERVAASEASAERV